MPYRITTSHGHDDKLSFCKCGTLDKDYRASYYISEYLKYQRLTKYICTDCKEQNKTGSK
jgi:hypothetical protein